MAELLLPLVLDGDLSMEVASIAALALGLVYQGTAHGDSVEAILQVRACQGVGKGDVGRVRAGGTQRVYVRCCSRMSLPTPSPPHTAPHCHRAPIASTALPLPPQALMLRGEADLTQPGGRLMCLALGLLFLHRQAAVDATLEVRGVRRGVGRWGRLERCWRYRWKLLQQVCNAAFRLTCA